MNGDSENEDVGPGSEPGSHESAGHPTTGVSDGDPAFRPFRAWASAYEPRESVWTRLRARMAAMFSRKATQPDVDEDEDATDADPTGVDATEPAAFEADEPASVDVAELAPEEEGEPAVAPPENFRFPWTRSRDDTTEPTPSLAPAPADSVVDEEPDSFDFDAAFDAAPARTTQPVHSMGADSETAFASMDEALPVAGFEAGDSDPEVEEIDVAAPPKRGFFSRLFRKASARPVLESDDEELEIEVHEDRIEAAAQALDEMGVEQFESFEGGSDAADAFASVEEALPDAMPELPPIVEPEPVLDVVDTESGRPTAEVDLELIPGLVEPGATETSAVDADGSDRDEVEAAFDGASTQEIEEKTDEFEIASLQEEEPTGEADTLEVEKKNFWTDSFIGKLFRRGDTQVEKVGASEEEAARESSGFLLAKFRAFYNEIIRFQHQKSEFTAGFATAIVTDYTADLSPDAAAEGLSKRLSELLELQAAEARWMGGEAGERYPDAQYAMAALADEIFTHSEWEGKAAWPKFSLEWKLHQSKDSDIEVFRRIDRLLKESPDSHVARDLARVYLLVLAAGFQGKWRPFGLTRPVAEYRRRLYEYIYGSDPLMLFADDRRIFPDASARTLEGHAVSRFTAMQRWAAILVFLLVSYTVVAHLAWNRVSADLTDVTSRIMSHPTSTLPPAAPTTSAKAR